MDLPSFKVISPEEAADIILSGDRDKTAFIDVRDTDYLDFGYIPGSINVESEDFEEESNIDYLIEVRFFLWY